MTTLEEAAALARNERGLVIVATLRGDGTIQSSLVNAGIVPHPATGESTLAFVTNGPVKLANLRARPQVTATFRNGWQWAAVKGHAEVAGPDDPQPGSTPNDSAYCSERSSPPPPASTTTGTPTTEPWPRNAEPPCSSAPTGFTPADEHGHEDVPRLACRGLEFYEGCSRQLHGLLDRP